MGFRKIYGSLTVTGGSVNLGADTNFYRSAANVIKTDDALTVTGIVTASAGVNAQGGTSFVAPYATASPTVDANGHISFVQKGDRSYLSFQCGGTPFHVMFPQTTHGTITTTVGGTP